MPATTIKAAAAAPPISNTKNKRVSRCANARLMDGNRFDSNERHFRFFYNIL